MQEFIEQFRLFSQMKMTDRMYLLTCIVDIDSNKMKEKYAIELRREASTVFLGVFYYLAERMIVSNYKSK